MAVGLLGRALTLSQLGFQLFAERTICEQEVCCGDLGSWVVRTMSEVQRPPENPATAGASRAAAQAEAPFVPEAASPAERAAGWKNPPSRMQLMLWSGSKRHVFVGMVGISVLATIPWLMLTSGIEVLCFRFSFSQFVMQFNFITDSMNFYP